MTPVLARIALRYVAASLATAGYLDADMASQIGVDPDLVMIVGIAMGAGIESLYGLAKKFGWRT
ncbi:MAG: hypothetical protein OJJ21_16600 [Ferrovibrio sp.]|uniref:hypothetical protein n=1 Tax=Ferrovibrio sp. TaxID=1917215 RepID=UPI002602C638|nr:hypothetical protein [Ferrovibrio sp.]MCW0235223.1 hypothetical protein [Ferrovibrio sp.]